jgi:hypothetical protein
MGKRLRPGFGEIAVRAINHGIGIAMSNLTGHGVVAGLVSFVGLLRTFAAVGIVEKMVARAFGHGLPFETEASIIRTTANLRYAENMALAMQVFAIPLLWLQVVVMDTIGKFNSRFMWS